MSNTYDFIKFCNQNVMDIKDELLKSFILKKLLGRGRQNLMKSSI